MFSRNASPPPPGGEVQYRFSGRCPSSGPAIGDALSSLRQRILQEVEPTALDVSCLEDVNSAFIGMISGLVAGLDEKGLKPVLVGPNKHIQDLLGIVGILEALEIRPAAT